MLKKNKVVILFLVKFFAVYFSLTGLYSLYLNSTQTQEVFYSCSPVTQKVAAHTKYATELLGYEVETYQSLNEFSFDFKVNDRLVVKIVEGCTSIAVMILFLSFIVAFTGRLKPTILFGLCGVLLIYATNIFRIVFLVLAIYHYPEYANILHDFVFPGMIYGMVFILWMIWVNKFATINRKE